MLSSTSFKNPIVRKQLISKVSNVMFLGYSTDHIRDNKGQAYVALRCHNGELIATDRNGKNITNIIRKAL